MEKKTYIIPSTSIVVMHPSCMVAVSIEKTTETFDSENMKFTKEDRAGRGSRSDYNVWNDDWSK